MDMNELNKYYLNVWLDALDGLVNTQAEEKKLFLDLISKLELDINDVLDSLKSYIDTHGLIEAFYKLLAFRVNSLLDKPVVGVNFNGLKTSFNILNIEDINIDYNILSDEEASILNFVFDGVL